MTKKEFQNFVSKTLDEVTLLCSFYSNEKIPKEISFKWKKTDAVTVFNRKEIIDEITNVIFVAESKIYPCPCNFTFKRSGM